MAAMAPENKVAFDEMIATFGTEAVAKVLLELQESLTHSQAPAEDDLTAEDLENMAMLDDILDDQAVVAVAAELGVPVEMFRRMLEEESEEEADEAEDDDVVFSSAVMCSTA